MVQIAMLVCGVAAGLKCRTWKQAALIILAVFVVVMVPQTIAVGSDAGENLGPIYWLIQLVSIGVGLGIARLLINRRARREVVA